MEIDAENIKPEPLAYQMHWVIRHTDIPYNSVAITAQLEKSLKMPKRVSIRTSTSAEIPMVL